uniref:Uncharacterized protein n=1 Tax=Romanomermis culicivorax TaxID=13658 RepID=A0A915L964_ROMCU
MLHDYGRDCHDDDTALKIYTTEEERCYATTGFVFHPKPKNFHKQSVLTSFTHFYRRPKLQKVG